MSATPPPVVAECLGVTLENELRTIFMGACADTIRIVARAIILRGLDLIRSTSLTRGTEWAHIQSLLQDELWRQIKARAEMRQSYLRQSNPILTKTMDTAWIKRVLSQEYPSAMIRNQMISSQTQRGQSISEKGARIYQKLSDNIKVRASIYERMFSIQWFKDCCNSFNKAIKSALSVDPRTVCEAPEFEATRTVILLDTSDINILAPAKGSPQSLAHHTDPKAVIDELGERKVFAKRRENDGNISSERERTSIADLLSARYRDGVPRLHDHACKIAHELVKLQQEIRSRFALYMHDANRDPALKCEALQNAKRRSHFYTVMLTLWHRQDCLETLRVLDRIIQQL